jgi:hypothetical protein
MTGYDYNYDFQVRHVGKQVAVTNNLGRTAIHNEAVYLGGYFGFVAEPDGIAHGAVGMIAIPDSDYEIVSAQVNATTTFVVGQPLYFKAGSSSVPGTFEDDASGGAVAIGTISGSQGSAESQTHVSFRPYVQKAVLSDLDARVTAVEAVTDGLAEDPGMPFRRTVTLTQAAATTPVEIIADAEVGAGKCVYITGMYSNVNGATGWSGTGSNVIVRDTAASPVAAITLAKATALAANAQAAFLTTGVTLGDGIKDGTGMTAAKGLEIVGDGAFSAGSDLIVTLVGFIGDVPA